QVELELEQRVARNVAIRDQQHAVDRQVAELADRVARERVRHLDAVCAFAPRTPVFDHLSFCLLGEGRRQARVAPANRPSCASSAFQQRSATGSVWALANFSLPATRSRETWSSPRSSCRPPRRLVSRHRPLIGENQLSLRRPPSAWPPAMTSIAPNGR